MANDGVATFLIILLKRLLSMLKPNYRNWVLDSLSDSKNCSMAVLIQHVVNTSGCIRLIYCVTVFAHTLLCEFGVISPFFFS